MIIEFLHGQAGEDNLNKNPALSRCRAIFVVFL
jgi:hypothetical protein